MNIDINAVFQNLKNRKVAYDEEIHCKLILKTMLEDGRVSAFCTKVSVTDQTFYKWLNKHPLFLECYSIGKHYAREAWEVDGKKIADQYTPPGTISHAFEHWKMIGWSRFGISKNSRIKLSLTPGATPNVHYAELLQQAANGDFTASEIKQLMEAVNVGLNAHQVFEMQKEIDRLRGDLATMIENANVQNTSSTKRVA